MTKVCFEFCYTRLMNSVSMRHIC